MENEVTIAIRDILKYLEKHPASKHTAEGIAKYWIYQQRLEIQLNHAIEAISCLLQQGFLDQETLPNGITYYKINNAKKAQIPSFLKNLNDARATECKSSK